MRHDLGRSGADACITFMRLDPALFEEALQLLKERKTTATVLAMVARFQPSDQRAMFEQLNAMGARAAKRYVEHLREPPTLEGAVASLVAFLQREYPTQSVSEHAAICEATAVLLRDCARRTAKRAD